MYIYITYVCIYKYIYINMYIYIYIYIYIYWGHRVLSRETGYVCVINKKRQISREIGI